MEIKERRVLDMDKDLEKVKNKAVDYLSRRDYGEEELFRKLKEKFPEVDSSLIGESLEKMKEYGYLSNERFVEVFIRQEKRNKSGPLKIKMKLKQKFIKDELIETYLNENDDEFYENCLECLEKKSKGSVKDFKEKQKLYRFLASRGYLSDHINYAFEEIGSKD